MPDRVTIRNKLSHLLSVFYLFYGAKTFSANGAKQLRHVLFRITEILKCEY